MNGFRQTLVVVLLFLGVVAVYDGHKQLQEQYDQVQTLSNQVRTQHDMLYSRLDTQTEVLALAVDYACDAHDRIDYHMNVLTELTKPFDLSVLDSCGIITDGYGYGSCVAIGPDLVLTAGHCLGYGEFWVEIGGKRYDVLEEWRDERYDVGFARVDAALPYLELGQRPQLLDEVYLVGAPGGTAFENNISQGIVTNLDVDVFYTSCQIVVDTSGWFGSSGGPLIDTNGEIIGIASFIPAKECDNIMVCVPVHQIRSALRSYCTQ